MHLPAKIRSLLNSGFVKNVTTLSLGTVISQAIVVLSSLLLARLFSVEAFGALSVYTSFTTLAAVLVTGRYEFAIVIPEAKETAISLVRLILSIGFFGSLVYFVVILILKEFFHFQDSTGFLTAGGAYWAAPFIFFIAANTAFGYWLLREKKYKVYSWAVAIQSISISVASILMGFLKIESGLIIALFVGAVVFTSFFLYKEPRFITALRKSHGLKKVAKDYDNFPRYKTFSDFAITLTQQFTPVLLSVLYSSTIVGFFGLANRMLRLPNIVVTYSIASVFRNDAMEEIRKNGNCRGLFLSTLKKLIWMALPVYLFLFIASPYLFRWFFGAAWLTSGYFAQIMVSFLCFEFIANPLNELYTLYNKQRMYMIIQVLYALVGAAMLVLGNYFFADATWSLILFSGSAVVFNIVLLFNSYRISLTTIKFS